MDVQAGLRDRLSPPLEPRPDNQRYQEQGAVEISWQPKDGGQRRTSRS